MNLRIKIDIPEEEDPPNPFPPEAIEKLETVFEEELPLLCGRLENLGKDAEVEISVSFLDKVEMRELNKQHRGLDEPTDVLTFPLWEESGGFEPLACASPLFSLLPLGDIVICPEETELEHASMARLEALCLVLAHGFLHLLGWDHDTPEKEKLMWERQESLKSKLQNAIERSMST